MELSLFDSSINDHIDLGDYDIVLINSSAGKDSQAMLDVVYHKAIEQNYDLDKMVVVHADLGKVEWQGTRELAEEQADHYGLRFIAVDGVTKEGDLLDHIEAKGMFPDSARRWCTSDHKRAKIDKVFTRLVNESGIEGRRVRILNCLGFRAEESPARAKRIPFSMNMRASNKTKRVIYDWLPVHDMLEGAVWDRIRKSGVPYHKAYDLGMPRLSCVFCVFAPKHQLEIAGKHNPELLSEYVRVEDKIGHSFRKDFKIAEVQQSLNNQTKGQDDEKNMG